MGAEWEPRGGGQNFQKLILNDFLAKLGNSKHFLFFFSFFFQFSPDSAFGTPKLGFLGAVGGTGGGPKLVWSVNIHH